MALRALRIVSILILAATAAACLPFPHRSFLSALVHGELRQGPEPLRQARLRLVADPGSSPCESEHFTEATTDADGRFVLCPVSRTRFLLSLLPGHRLFKWNVCLQTSDRSWKAIASGDQYTLGDSGPRLLSRIDCDFDSSFSCSTRDTWDFDADQIRAALAGKQCEGM